MAGQPETGSGRTSHVVPPTLERLDDAAIGVPDTTPVAIAYPHPSANDTIESKSDRRDLVDLLDALADYTADLLTQGKLDDLLPEAALEDSSDRIAFTSAGPPSIK